MGTAAGPSALLILSVLSDASCCEVTGCGCRPVCGCTRVAHRKIDADVLVGTGPIVDELAQHQPVPLGPGETCKLFYLLYLLRLERNSRLEMHKAQVMENEENSLVG